jgi:hypothetical protein
MINLIKRDNLIWEWQDLVEDPAKILEEVLLKGNKRPYFKN